jgi:hypothetical protein
MRFSSGKHADIKHSTMFALECLLLPFVLFEVCFPENKNRCCRRAMYTCVYLHKNRAMTISVEQREDELTTKGSDRILVSKTVTPSDIVDPEQATRHTAKAFGAIVAFQNGSDSATNFRGIRSTEYSRQKLRRHYLKFGVYWVCAVRRQLQKCRWNCTFSKKSFC